MGVAFTIGEDAFQYKISSLRETVMGMEFVGARNVAGEQCHSVEVRGATNGRHQCVVTDDGRLHVRQVIAQNTNKTGY